MTSRRLDHLGRQQHAVILLPCLHSCCVRSATDESVTRQILMAPGLNFSIVASYIIFGIAISLDLNITNSSAKGFHTLLWTIDQNCFPEAEWRLLRWKRISPYILSALVSSRALLMYAWEIKLPLSVIKISDFKSTYMLFVYMWSRMNNSSKTRELFEFFEYIVHIYCHLIIATLFIPPFRKHAASTKHTRSSAIAIFINKPSFNTSPILKKLYTGFQPNNTFIVNTVFSHTKH